MATVMVVDDTPVIRETVARLLRREGYKTTCAANGREALDMLNLALPDVVLLDIMMPEMDGMECLSIVRKEPRWQGLPVILMTALSDETSVNRAQELGAWDYLVKARSSIAEMLDSVKRCLHKDEPEN